MKRILILLLMLSLAACAPQNTQDTSLETSSEVSSFTPGGGDHGGGAGAYRPSSTYQ